MKITFFRAVLFLLLSSVFVTACSQKSSDPVPESHEYNPATDTSHSKVSISDPYSESAEGDSAQTFTITIDPIKNYDVTFDYDLVSSTAVDGVHYSGIAKSGTLTIGAGQGHITVKYNFLENALADGEKFLQLNLSHFGHGKLEFGFNFARHYMTDNDSTPINSLGLKMEMGSSSCVIATDGVLKCWGNNTYGQLGDGTLVQSNSPIVIDSGTSYSTVSTSNSHTC